MGIVQAAIRALIAPAVEEIMGELAERVSELESRPVAELSEADRQLLDKTREVIAEIEALAGVPPPPAAPAGDGGGDSVTVPEIK